MALIEDKIDQILSIDILKKGINEEFLVGKPYYLDYSKAQILISDAWKHRAGGIPHGSFLLAFYTGDSDPDRKEALLLRAIAPSKLPTDNDVVSSMIEYYKDNVDITNGQQSKLDTFTRYEFSFSGLECRILGTFYKIGEEGQERIEFGADVENFYSANNYVVYKASGDVLRYIVNLRSKDDIVGSQYDFPIGKVRYSSSRRFQYDQEEVEVYINPKDFLGKRTALFGMTRTGKSNTLKKIIEATQEISSKAKNTKDDSHSVTDNFEGSAPRQKVGQIIFDMNGEYANPNQQDEGTAIYDLFTEQVTRYSVLEKEDFKVMKVNFFKEIESGFDLIRSYLENRNINGDYVNNFTAVDLSIPDDADTSARIRIERLRSAYLCCLKEAGFKVPDGFKVKFTGKKEINEKFDNIDPSNQITLDQATKWFKWVWKNYEDEIFRNYEQKKNREWADDDLKAMMIFLTGYKSPNEKNSVSGYKKIRVKDLHDLHTSTSDSSFETEIPKLLQEGKIVIVDLSQGSPVVQSLFAEKICTSVFARSMDNFVKNIPNNFIQFYFEEAHNLFPKKEDKDLSQIYNRIAKEGAKLNIGMTYATQEVSSISANILKNTQNWFIAHLNNEEEIRELRKYYDFSDFADSLVKFSSDSDKGFVRMKTYTNPFVVPVQIDRFLANKE
ncbi:MAG TPA: DUF87 domain-containing protein [Candidatus Woesebacteria bacterium]|nr:DUF87 domain-containing protein [Candidatus Woesebacteria bacterium]